MSLALRPETSFGFFPSEYFRQKFTLFSSDSMTRFRSESLFEFAPDRRAMGRLIVLAIFAAG